MSVSLSRRSFAAGSLLAMLGGAAALPTTRPAAAQGVDLSSLGLPTLDITMTDSGFEGMPETLEAGRYLVNVAVPESLPEGGGADFVSPPAGMTPMEWMEGLGLGGDSPSMASPEAGAAPESEEGSPEFVIPSYVYQSHWAGGAVGMGGTTAQAVVDLVEGEWILVGDDPFGAQMPMTFMVTGSFPATVTEPEAEVMMTFIEFAIMVDGSLSVGDHVVRIENLGAQPHFVFVAKGPDLMTNDYLAMFLGMEMGGAASPEALPFDPDTDLMPVLSTATQSIDTVQWVPVTFEAGTYAALCFFPNAGEGLPHAFHGMHTVFTVG